MSNTTEILAQLDQKMIEVEELISKLPVGSRNKAQLNTAVDNLCLAIAKSVDYSKIIG